MKSEEELSEFLKIRLQPELLPLENYRIKKIKSVKLYGEIALGLMILFLLLFLIKSSWAPISFFLFFISGAYAIQVLLKTNRVLRRSFKERILQKLLEFLFDQYVYLPRQRIARSVVEKSMLIAYNIASVEGEDYMQFKIGDSIIHFCEATIYGTSSTSYAVFSGIFLSSTFNKNFSSHTIVSSKNLSILVKNYQRLVGREFKRVKLEDPHFEKSFIVYTTDQVEARYILSTSMMQRLLDYKNKTGKKVSFSFTRNRMYCTIPNYINLFEPALFESFYDIQFIKKSYDALKLYTDIVTDLHLNISIWGKDADVS